VFDSRYGSEITDWLRAHPEQFAAQLSSLLHGMANLDRASTDPALRERSLARYAEAIETAGRVYGADSERVSHVWMIEPVSQTLEVLRLDGDTYRIVKVASGSDRVRAEPFDAIELDLAMLWMR
jgi:hypothetical protein